MPLRSPQSDAARAAARYREVRKSGDHEQIAAAAEACVRAYGILGDTEKQLEFMDVLGRSQILAGAYSASMETTTSMLNSQTVQANPLLKAKALILRAAALRNKAIHAAAIAYARQALTTLESVKGSSRIRAEAYQALIASLVEAKKIGEAWSLREQLARALAGISDARLEGHGYWTLGNLAFAHGQLAEGLDYHNRAAGFLKLADDVNVWARFNAASADMQLQAGIANEQTADCIERAKLAYDIIGASKVELAGLAVTRARWNVSKGDLAKASDVLAEATKAPDDGQPVESASTHVLWAEILTKLGRHADAERERRNAARIHEALAGNQLGAAGQTPETN